MTLYPTSLSPTPGLVPETKEKIKNVHNDN